MRSYATRDGAYSALACSRLPLSTASVNALVVVTSSAVCASRYSRYCVDRGLAVGRELGRGGAGHDELARSSAREPPGQSVVYVPAFKVSENSLFSPGATFSTSPMMRSPERISNSLTSPEPEFGDLEVGGAGLDRELGRAAVVVDLDLDRSRLGACGRRRDRPPVRRHAIIIAAAARPVVRNMLRIPPRIRLVKRFRRSTSTGAGGVSRRAPVGASAGRRRSSSASRRAGRRGPRPTSARAGCRTCR